MRSVHPPLSPLRQTEVFATEARSAQLFVRTTAASVEVRVEGRVVTASTVGGVAIIELDGLDPGCDYRAEIISEDRQSIGLAQFTTRQDMGSVTARFASISDVHLGLDRFGVGRKLSDKGSVPYAMRCARAAIEEATGWGAQLLIVKGDLTEGGNEDDWLLAEELFADVAIPILFTPGNHDVLANHDVTPHVGAARIGLPFDAVQIHELDGVRLVIADTSRPSRGTGDLARHADEILEAVDSATPAFLAFHHNIQRTPVPWFWPPGISSTNANPVTRALAETNPRIFLSSGHTHRNRVHWLGPERSLPYTEVSSTSDYPGVWAGYEVSTAGIRQTVRRIRSPEALAWTERTRRVLGGVWPRWSQGRLHDRCVDFVFRQP